MLKPSDDSVFGPQQSRYSLVVAVAKRAREISNYAEAHGDILIEKPVDLAVQDLVNNKYRIVEPKQSTDD